MTHVVADGYHLDIGIGKHVLATLHDRLFLTEKHQRIERLFLGHQGVAGNLVVADMRTELDESFLLPGQLQEIVVALGLDMELLPCIHGKTVDDYLTEEAMVDIRAPCSPPEAIPVTLAEIAADDFRTLAEEHRDRNDEERCEGI